MSATGKVIVAFLSGIAIGAIASAYALDGFVTTTVLTLTGCALVAHLNAGNPP